MRFPWGALPPFLPSAERADRRPWRHGHRRCPLWLGVT
jgi:hypothetical protein